MRRTKLWWLLPVLGVAAGTAFAHETAGASGPMTLGAHDLLRYLHVVLLVFWLGPDVAIMVAGTNAANTALSAAQRASAARMMQYYEVMPRVCTSLMLTVGGVLSEQVGLVHPWWQMAAIWLLGPVWLALTLAAYFGGSAGAGRQAARLEEALRVVLIVAIPVSVAYATATGRLAPAPYVGGKLLLFALVLLFGLLARRALGPFRTGAARLGAQGASPALDAAMSASFASGRRWVAASWAALLLAALLGVVQPGVPGGGAGAGHDEHAAPR